MQHEKTQLKICAQEDGEGDKGHKSKPESYLKI